MSEAGEGRAQDLCQAPPAGELDTHPEALRYVSTSQNSPRFRQVTQFERTIVPLWSPSPPSLSPIYVCELCGHISLEVAQVTDFAEMWTLLHQARSKPLCEACDA